MAISTMEAFSRLLAKFIEHVTEHPDSALLLKDLLCKDNIQAVARLDLYAEYGLDRRRRDHALLNAWMGRHHAKGGIQ
jgi:hypothetical protein